MKTYIELTGRYSANEGEGYLTVLDTFQGLEKLTIKLDMLRHWISYLQYELSETEKQWNREIGPDITWIE